MPYALAAIALLMSVTWLPIPSGVSSPRWWAIGVGCCLLLCFTRSIRMTTEHVLGSAILAWCALTALWSYSFYDSVGALIALIIVSSAFCVAAEIRTLVPFYFALALGATINAGIAIAQMQGVSLFDLAHIQSDMPTGVFGNKNFLANFGVLALIGSLSLCRKSWPLIVGSAVAAFLPMSRGAMIAFGVAMLVKYWQRSWNIVAGLAFMVATSALCIAVLYTDLYFSNRITTSIMPRLEMWDWAVSNFRWFGWGHGTFGSIFPFEHASNDFLETIFELGVGSSLVFSFFALVLTRSLGRTERSIIAAALVEACTAFPLHQAATVFVVAVVAGRLAGMHRRALDSQPVGGDDYAERLSLPWPLSAREVHATDLCR